MKVWIFSLEKLENRYTKHWHSYIPQMFLDAGYEIETIDGDTGSTNTSPGAFLDFTNTNIRKSTQLTKFISKVNSEEVGNDDHILITDAWNPCATQLKYIKELSGKNWTLHGIYRAGSYDPQDHGKNEKSHRATNLEKSFYSCYDHNYFATDFHINMFVDNVFGPWHDEEESWKGEEYTMAGWLKAEQDKKKIVRTGFPFDYTTKLFGDYPATQKKDSIVFPHRIAPEKNLEIFKALEKELPQYEFIVCQEQNLTKDEYHEILLSSKICFSASQQETLGISQNLEAPVAECIPLCPDHLSYSEIFKNYPEFLYPCYWGQTRTYEQNKEGLKSKIIDIMENYDWYAISLAKYLEEDAMKYFRADDMMNIFNSYRQN